MKKLKTTVSVILATAILITMTPTTDLGAAKLTKPKKVTIKSVKSTYNTVTIKWKKQKKSKKVKKYFVQIKKGNEVDKYKVKKNKNVLKVGGLEPGTTYKVRVRAKNAKGYGKWSKYVEISTKPFQGKTYEETTTAAEETTTAAEETTTVAEETTTPYVVDIDRDIEPLAFTYANEKKIRIIIMDYNHEEHWIQRYNEETRQFETITKLNVSDAILRTISSPSMIGFVYNDKDVELNKVYYYRVVLASHTAEQMEKAVIIATKTSDSLSYESTKVATVDNPEAIVFNSFVEDDSALDVWWEIEK